MSIIDGRTSNKHKQNTNRHKFLEKNRSKVKQQIDRMLKRDGIKDLADGDKKITIDPTEEKTPQGKNLPKDKVGTSNNQFDRGERLIWHTSDSDGPGNNASGDGQGEDAFEFLLSQEDFQDILFENLELPNIAKRSLKKNVRYRMVTGGYSKDGIPPRLSVKKTFEQALARRIACKNSKKKPPWLDETDLRFIRRSKQIIPDFAAVVFCVMDVSGSMREIDKMIAKKYFMLLYVFLKRHYKNVELVFIRYHSRAKECDEEEFFYSQESGGTNTSKAFECMRDIITERYDSNKWNIYCAQVSDGDNWGSDNGNCIRILNKDIIPTVQYMTYIQIIRDETHGLYNLYKNHLISKDNFKQAVVQNEPDIFHVFTELFKKRDA